MLTNGFVGPPANPVINPLSPSWPQYSMLYKNANIGAYGYIIHVMRNTFEDCPSLHPGTLRESNH